MTKFEWEYVFVSFLIICVVVVFVSGESVKTIGFVDSMFLKNDGDNATGSYDFDSGTFQINSTSNSVGIGKNAGTRAVEWKAQGGEQVSGSGECASSVSCMIGLMDAQTTNDATVGIGALDNDLGLRSGGAYRAILDSVGNFGIGTTNPSNALHVVDSLNNAVIAVFRNTDNRGFSGFNFRDESDDNSATITYANSGASLFPSSLWIGSRLATEPIIFTAGGTTEYMRLTSNGNLGIGTIIPSFLLHVGGNNDSVVARFDGNVSADGYFTTTDVYDKSTSALDEIKDKSFYLNPDKSINHNAFGYSSVSYNKEVVDYYINVSNDYEFFNETLNKNITITEYYQQPVMKNITEEGIDLVKEVSMLKQAVHELNQKIILLQK